MSGSKKSEFEESGLDKPKADEPEQGESESEGLESGISEFDKSEYVHGVFSAIAGSYDLMNDLESLGLHRVWKARLVHELSALHPTRILDIACGTGDISLALAKANPEAEVIGLDFNEDMLMVARRRATLELPLSFTVEFGGSGPAASKGLAAPASKDQAVSGDPADLDGRAVSTHLATSKPRSNLSFVTGNALDLPFEDGSFDAVTISFGLRNMPDYAAVLGEVLRVLGPAGHFFCLEASYPTNRLVVPPFKLYFKHWLPVLGKLIVNSPEQYAWLNTSTEAFLSKDQLAQLMKETGFAGVSYSSYLLGAAALHRGSVAESVQ